MFKLFKKSNGTPVLFGVWQKISAVVDAKARRFANWLNSKAEKISHRTMTYLLVAGCIYWGAGCMYIILTAVHKKKNPFAFSVTAIAVPKQIISSAQRQDAQMDSAIERIEHYAAWLLSLRDQHSTVYDSIVQARPGLLDSIEQVKKYYYIKK